MVGIMPPSYVPLEPKWRHWPTYIYDQNYRYGINYYQPMLDYIEHKKQASSTSSTDYYHHLKYSRELPDLPWSDGRGLWEEKPVEPYSNRELISRAFKAEDLAREHLNNFKVANRSHFSLAKTAQASHVTRDILPRTLKAVGRSSPALLAESARLRRQRQAIEQKIMADINMQSLKDIQAQHEIENALEHGKSLRGKSARAIEFQLRAEALRNLTKSQELADIRKCQRECMQQVAWDEREHLRLMEERTRNLLDEDKLAAPLTSLSRELRGFEQKSTNYFLDKRYPKPRGPGCMYMVPR